MATRGPGRPRKATKEEAPETSEPKVKEQEQSEPEVSEPKAEQPEVKEPEVKSKVTPKAVDPNISYEYVKQGVVFVCEACGKQMATDLDRNLTCQSTEFPECPRLEV